MPARPLATFALLVALAIAATAHAKPTTHTIYKGQTLGMIAKRYNVTIDALCTANGLDRRKPIKPGIKLVIPAREDKSGKAAAKAKAEAEAEAKSKAKPKSKPAKKTTAPKPPTKTTAAAKATKQDKAQAAGSYQRRPAKPGHVHLRGGFNHWQGRAVNSRGSVVPSARKAFRDTLRSKATGERANIHGRLIQLVAKVSDHFGGRTIEVVSGYRPPSKAQYTKQSRHNLGHAIDMRVDGVPNTVLRDYLRKFKNVGVGYYPTSGFCHLDVRPVTTYWIDYSGPGQPPQYSYRGWKRSKKGIVQRAKKAAVAKRAPKSKQPRATASDEAAKRATEQKAAPATSAATQKSKTTKRTTTTKKSATTKESAKTRG